MAFFIKRTSRIGFVIIGVFAAALIYIIFKPASETAQRGGRNDSGPVPVLVTKAEQHDMPIEVETIGTVQALNTVTVRSQVDGRLVDLTFQDGQDVKAGDVLARIDPTIYQAQYDQAIAKKAQDEANLANAEHDLQRYIDLSKTEYAPKQQADTQRALVDQLKAQIAADGASIDNAKAYLDYTTIRAPISGRTGIRQVDRGNILHATDQTGIVTINEIEPIYVMMTLPQQHLAALHRAMSGRGVPVAVHDSESGHVIAEGHVETLDNLVDAASGTIKLKAIFDNTDLNLWPGEFVTAIATLGVLPNAVLVPTSAVQRGPSGPFVYLVDAQSKAVMRPVSIAHQTEQTTAIATGVDAGDTVITSGFNRLTDGATIRADTAAPDQPAPQSHKRSQYKSGQKSSDGTASGASPATPSGSSGAP